MPENRVNPLRLRVEDAGEVLTLQRAAYVTEAQAHGDLSMPPLTQTLDQLRTELSDPAVLGWGVREGGRLVASVRVRLIEPGVAEVGRLVVAPDRQGHGLGSGLLHAAEARLPGAVRLIRLFTGEHSHANLRLYQRLGYHETGRTAAGNYQLVHLAKSRLPPGRLVAAERACLDSQFRSAPADVAGYWHPAGRAPGRPRVY